MHLWLSLFLNLLIGTKKPGKVMNLNLASPVEPLKPLNFIKSELATHLPQVLYLL